VPPDRIDRLAETGKVSRLSSQRLSKIESSSLHFSSSIKKLELKVGDVLIGKITAVYKDGKEVEVDFGKFKARARWNSYLEPEVGRKIVVTVRDVRRDIVLKLLDLKLTNFKDFFLRHFATRDKIFSVVKSELNVPFEGFSKDYMEFLVKNSGIFFERKILNGDIQEPDIKHQILEKVSSLHSDSLVNVLNTLEAYNIANQFSKDFFIIPLFIPLPEFKKTELFLNKEELRNFKEKGFLTIVLMIELEKYGDLKISILLDKQEKSIHISFEGMDPLIEKLKKHSENISRLFSQKYKTYVKFLERSPTEVNLTFNPIPVSIEVKA
jgi:hypothetical protein